MKTARASGHRPRPRSTWRLRDRYGSDRSIWPRPARRARAALACTFAADSLPVRGISRRAPAAASRFWKETARDSKVFHHGADDIARDIMTQAVERGTAFVEELMGIDGGRVVFVNRPVRPRIKDAAGGPLEKR